MTAPIYEDMAEVIKNFLVTRIEELDATTATVADIDAVMDGLYENNSVNAGLVVDFLYSVPHVGESGRRANDLWDTFIGGLLILQFTGRDNTESKKNLLIKYLMEAFDGGNRKVLTAGTVGTVAINNAGTGYSASDVLTITGGSGDCTLTVDGVGGSGEVTGVTVSNSGSLYRVSSAYRTTPSVIGGTGATIDVTTINTVVATDRVSITRIERPQKLMIAEHPFYYMPFTLKVNHGGK